MTIRPISRIETRWQEGDDGHEPGARTVLFLAGHALFMRAIWDVVSVSRIVGILVLIASAGLVPFVPTIGLVVATVVAVGIGVADRIVYGRADPARAEAS